MHAVCMCVSEIITVHCMRQHSAVTHTQQLHRFALNKDKTIFSCRFLTVRMAAASSCSWCSCLCRWKTVLIFNSWVSVLSATAAGTSTSTSMAGVISLIGCGGGVAVDFLRHLAMRRFFIMRSRRSTRAATFISCNLPSNDAWRRCQIEVKCLCIVSFFSFRLFFLLFSSTFNLYLTSPPSCLP